jgi:hypothetical protein
LRDPRDLWHNHMSAMSSHGHRTTEQLAGPAGHTSYADGTWRYYAWRFI